MEDGGNITIVPHNGQHVSRLDVSGNHLFFITLVYFINEGPVPRCRCIKVVPEGTIHKGVNDIGEADKQPEMKVV